MSKDQPRYLKEVKESLKSALKIIAEDTPETPLSLQELKSAAAQATQASIILHQLVGMKLNK